MRRSITLLLMLFVLVPAVPEPAQAQKVCDGFVRAKGKKWLYQGQGVGCKFMHASTKAFLRDDVEPKGWNCTRVRTRGLCQQKKGGDATFIFYVKP